MVENLEWFTQFQKLSAEGNAIGLVAEEEDQIIGFCEVIRKRDNSPVAHRGDLGLSVKKEYRGRGVGSKLLEETIRRCKNKFEILELDVYVGNERARCLYKKFGFKSCGILPKPSREMINTSTRK